MGRYPYAAAYSQSSLLGYEAETDLGFETAVFGWPGAVDPPVIQKQLVGDVWEAQIFWIGNLGLNPRPLNLSSQNNEYDAPLTSLRKQNLIPSTTWAYTAGFRGSQPPTFGSLTLGGYDATRFAPNNPPVSIPFGSDQSRDLLIAIQAISSTSASGDIIDGLLPDPIYAFIDSTISTIWLPLEACQAFENAFNLTWIDINQYYILNDDQHNALLAANPSVTFTLGSALAGGGTVSITLPYAAFDLQFTAPMTSTPYNYFPLQRAANSTQYVLGRTFLQGAYVIADYERNNFSVAQALFPQQDVKANIVPILAPGENASQASAKTKLSKGAIGGIVIGAVMAATMIVAAGVIFVRRRRSNKIALPSSPTDTTTTGNERPSLSHHPSSHPPDYGAQIPYEKPELHSECSPPLRQDDVMWGKTELSGDSRAISELAEKQTKMIPHEMDARQTVTELDGTSRDGRRQGVADAKKDGRVLGQISELE